MRAEFNIPAMENKIRMNLDKGWSLKGMYLASLREKESLLKDMQQIEARDIELSDQIEYMKENYAKPISL